MDLRIWVEGTVVSQWQWALSFLPKLPIVAWTYRWEWSQLVLYSFRRGLLPGRALFGAC